MKPCPSCGRRVQDAATKCHYCGAIVRAPRAKSDHQQQSAPPPRPEAPRIYAFRFTIAIVMIVAALVWLLW